MERPILVFQFSRSSLFYLLIVISLAELKLGGSFERNRSSSFTTALELMLMTRRDSPHFSHFSIFAINLRNILKEWVLIAC